MPAVKRLLHSTPFILLSIQISSFVVPWLIVLWLSHAKGAEQVGAFSFILAILAPLTLLLSSPSRNYLLSSQSMSSGDAVSLRASLALLGLILTLLIGQWSGEWGLVITLYLFKMTEQLFDLPIASAIKSEQKRQLLLIALGKWIAIILAAAAAFFSQNLYFTLAFVSFCFVAVCLPKIQLSQARWKASDLIRLAKLTLPLSMSALAFSVYFNIPRYVLGEGQQHILLSVFSVSSFLVMGALVALNTFVQSRLHLLRSAFSDKNERDFAVHIKHCVWVLIGLFIALQIGHIPWVADLFWLAHNDIHLTGGDQTYVYTLVLLLSCGPLAFSFANYLFVISDRHRLLLFSVLGNVGITFLLATLMFDKYAFNGLIVVITISSMAQLLLGILVTTGKMQES